VIVDASALIAILRAEADAAAYAAALAASDGTVPRISAANWLEAAIVIDSAKDPIASRRFDELVQRAGLQIAPVTERQARIARDAYRDFGKGSGHGAQLNFGDCLAYALAKEADEPLLFKGADFAATDIASVL
jgi:ribonuclease VapC